MGFKNSAPRKEVATAFCFLIFSTLYLGFALRLKVGTAGNPGPGFFPIVIGVLLSVCSLILLLRLFRTKDTPEAGPTVSAASRRNYGSIVGIFACTLAYPFVLDMLGFFVATAGAVFIMFVLLNPRRPIIAFSLAIGLAAVSFLVFPILLGVAFPFGRIDEFLYHLIGG